MTKPAALSIDEAVALLEEFGPNCLLGICCPPERQREALARMLNIAMGTGSTADGKAAAACILDHFDLAPKGTITPLLRKASELALNGTP